MAKGIPPKHYFIAFLWFLIPALVCFYVYHSYKVALPQKLSDQVQLTGSLATQDFKRTVRSNVQALQNLTERIEETDGAYYDYWKQDAKRLLKQNESLDFVEIINADGIIEDVYPRRPNVPAIGLDISKLGYRFADWKSKSNQGITNITQWLHLSQGGDSFLIDVPVYINDEFQGTVTGGMNFNEEFDRLSYYLKDFAIQIFDEEGTQFYNYNNYDLAQKDPYYIFETAMIMDSDLNESWNFQLTFSNPDFFAEEMLLINIALAVGLILSLAIGLLSFFNRNAQVAARRTFVINKELKKVNQHLEEQTQRANQASIAKTEFLSNMSHEIRTPLNAIVGITDLIGSGTNTFEEEHYLSLLKQSSKTLLNLINDILRLDKIESGFSEVAHIKFCPSDVLKNIEQFNLQVLKDKGIAF
ncbi:MAG: histidine kinase dimerization/phospho-acceptor domain-containing protein, partial [Bacteroidota bacterium]|nr:histidine kinase dimerization/phospho-acceptor domain-containing protein [Bacteroidota bacterium]